MDKLSTSIYDFVYGQLSHVVLDHELKYDEEDLNKQKLRIFNYKFDSTYSVSYYQFSSMDYDNNHDLTNVYIPDFDRRVDPMVILNEHLNHKI